MKTFPNEISMRQASIFELRTLARNMGVNSPTTYKKEELINKMLKIINGDEKPEVPKSRAGRPPKQIISSGYNNRSAEDLFNASGDVGHFQTLNKYDFSKGSFTEEFSVLASPDGRDMEGELLTSSFDFESRVGYVHTLENESCFVFEQGKVASVENVVNIPYQKANRLSLRNGDLVKVLCKKDGISGNRYFVELQEFENQKVKDFSQLQLRPLFENLQISNVASAKNVFDVADKNIGFLTPINNCLCGTRNILLCENLRNYKDLVLDLRNSNSPCSVVNICLEVLPEEEVIVKNGANFESFYTCYGDFEKQNNHTVSLAIDRIKRLAELGKNVVVLVNEVGKIIKYSNFSQGNDVNDLKYKSMDNVFKLMALARNFENGNSITVFALLKENKNNSNFSQILSELDNLNCNLYKI